MSIDIELNSPGIRALLRSGEMKGVCEEQASAIANRCGDGYASESGTGVSRAYANVKTSSARGHYNNLKNNTLLKSLRG